MTNEATRDSASNYLKQAFELNPMWRSSDLIDLRAQQFKFRRLDKSNSHSASGDIQQLRDAYREFLNRIQSQFWQLPQPVLIQQLSSINTAQLPELVPVLDRLKTVANLRAEFPKLAQEAWMVGPLFHAFKTAVVLPQAEAGIVRERFTNSIPHKKELSAIRRAVANMENQYPVLFALEKNFFQTLLKLELNAARPVATSFGSQSSGVFDNYRWLIFFLVFALLKVIVAVVSQMGSSL